MDPLPSVEFWLALGQIAAASLLLAGDNAVVIALAARRFPEARRQAARRTGSIAAVALRIALCPLAAWLLALPLAGLAAGLLLAWTALRLLMPERAGPFAAAGTARGVLPFILMADIVVAAASAVAIAGVARGNALLIALGLLVSIPLIAAGGRIVLAVLPRTPLLLAAGAGLLGWIAGGIIARDAALAGLPLAPSPAAILPPAVALLVVALGSWLARRAGRHPGPIIDLAPRDLQ
jgi:YjbE family integral membrane protein